MLKRIDYTIVATSTPEDIGYTVPSGKAFIVSNGFSWIGWIVAVWGISIGILDPNSNFAKWLVFLAGDILQAIWSAGTNISISGEEVDNV